jgi:ParB family transcriptional regulator, chromosome partitioning protein
VEALVVECGSADMAGERLHRTKGWVSQRRALLKLDPELQAALRRGELAIREARALAQVPLEQQVARWRATLDKHDSSNNPPPTTGKPAPSQSRVIATAVAKFDSQPDLLADALRTYLGHDGVKRLLVMLQSEPASNGEATTR